MKSPPKPMRVTEANKPSEAALARLAEWWAEAARRDEEQTETKQAA